MTNKPLTIVGASLQVVRAPARVSDASAPPQRKLAIEVDNPSDQPVYVWTSRRHYDYDKSTNTLTLYLTEHTPEPPPGIEIVSNHPRTPKQTSIDANSRASVSVSVPALIRRRVPSQGLGMQFTEEPIGEIARVDLHLQYASQRAAYSQGESPSEHRARLRQHGDVVRASITLSEQKEP